MATPPRMEVRDVRRLTLDGMGVVGFVVGMTCLVVEAGLAPHVAAVASAAGAGTIAAGLRFLGR